MAELLSEDEKNEFFAAMRDLADTFYKDVILYEVNKPGFDRYNEDRPNQKQTIELPCRVETLEAGSPIRDEVGGSIDATVIAVTFNFEELQEHDLINSEGQATFKPDVDFFTWAGDLYRVRKLEYDDTNFAGQYVLVLVYGVKEVKSS